MGKFEAKAEELIQDIITRGKLPILVGGTHYYTQSLLFKDYMIERSERQASAQEVEKRWPILTATGEEMLGELRKLDPIMADRWHPRDLRKIRRSLLICLQSGRKASDIYSEKFSKMSRISTDRFLDGGATEKGHELPDSKNVHPTLRYNTLLFWVHTESDVLKIRLNDRVDRMIDKGLLTEVQSMRVVHEEQKASGRFIDITRGIWVAIGYKEFEGYLAAKEQDVADKELEKLKIDGIERTKAATRQYGKSQLRWIRLKLVPALRRAGVADNLFVLDTTDVSAWASQVEDLAFRLTDGFLTGRLLPSPASTSPAAGYLLNEGELDEDIAGKPCARVCEICETTLMTQRNWEQHLNSRKHKSILKRVRKEIDVEGKLR